LLAASGGPADREERESLRRLFRSAQATVRERSKIPQYAADIRFQRTICRDGQEAKVQIKRFALRRPPVIRPLLIIQVPDTSDKRRMALTFRPIDGFSLRFEGPEHVVRMVLDDIIVDTAPLAALGTWFNVNIRHALYLPGWFLLTK